MKAKAHLDLSKDKEGQWSFQYHTPETVYPRIRSKAALEKELEWHSHPFIKMRTPDSPAARRYHVERQRPALRFLCRKYGVEIPSWLKGNKHYDTLPPEEHEELFGKGKLKVREYTPHETQASQGAEG